MIIFIAQRRIILYDVRSIIKGVKMEAHLVGIFAVVIIIGIPLLFYFFFFHLAHKLFKKENT